MFLIHFNGSILILTYARHCSTRNKSHAVSCFLYFLLFLSCDLILSLENIDFYQEFWNFHITLLHNLSFTCVKSWFVWRKTVLVIQLFKVFTFHGSPGRNPFVAISLFSVFWMKNGCHLRSWLPVLEQRCWFYLGMSCSQGSTQLPTLPTYDGKESRQLLVRKG